MTIETLRQFFLWCMVIEFGLLFFWLLMFTFARDVVKRVHGQWFKLSDEQFDAIHYSAMAHYKLGIFIFSAVPFVALSIIA